MVFGAEFQSTIAQALDRFSLAVLLIGVDGQVLFANQAAKGLLSRGSDLQLSGRRLAATTVGLAAPIEAFLQQVTLRGNARHQEELCIAIPRQEASHPYVLHLVPLSDGWPDGSEAVGMAVIIDALSGDGNDGSAIGPLFGLTPAELTVARLIRDGLTVHEIGAELRVSLNTVRSHLKKAFQKLGVRRQAELVRLMTLASVLRVGVSESAE